MKRSALKRKPPKPRKRRSKSPILKLEDKLWRLFSTYIRERDNWTCFTCGKREMGRTMHAGHFIGRIHRNTKYDPRNNHAQCASCNTYLYGNIAKYSEKLIETYGMDEFKRLIRDGGKTRQWLETELQELIDILQSDPSQYETTYYSLHNAKRTRL